MFHPMNGEPNRPLYAYSHGEIDASINQEEIFMSARFSGGLRLSRNIRRVKLKAAFDADAQQLAHVAKTTGFDKADEKLTDAYLAKANAEYALFHTKPQTLAGLRAALALARKCIAGGDWEGDAVDNFLAGMVRQ
jgi:hypothetical protein